MLPGTPELPDSRALRSLLEPALLIRGQTTRVCTSGQRDDQEQKFVERYIELGCAGWGVLETFPGVGWSLSVSGSSSVMSDSLQPYGL